MQNNSGLALLEFTINLAISSIVLLVVIQQLFMITKISIKLQQEFDYQNAYLVARQFISNDLKQTINFYVADKTLTLQNANSHIAYYVRESIIPKNNHMHSLALYRDDYASEAVAIAEGILDFIPILNPGSLQILLVFKNSKQGSLKFTYQL